jgi:putative ATP-dependent endonuclease of OLD family
VRRWRAVRDFGRTPADQEDALAEHRKKRTESDGQCVRTFVADHWTLEYDLAFAGLAREVHAAAYLAINEEKVDQRKASKTTLLADADAAFKTIEATHSFKDAQCSAIYKMFKRASKSIAAQHLIDLIEQRFVDRTLDVTTLRGVLPEYVIHAIEYATSGSAIPAAASTVSAILAGVVADPGSPAPVGEGKE